MNTATKVVLESLPEEISTLLRDCGTFEQPHSGRVLIDHLTATYSLLKDWGNSEPVCMAGLFHSIYGTHFFQHQSISRDSRGYLQRLIGLQAEELVWLFCSIDRPRTLLNSVQQFNKQSDEKCTFLLDARLDEPNINLIAARSQLHQLVEIECANLMEQQFWKGALRDLYCAAIEQEVLSKSAMSALRKSYSIALTNTNIKGIG